MINGRLEVESHDGESERFPDLAEDELYPAHATSRGLVDLILDGGENRGPGEVGARSSSSWRPDTGRPHPGDQSGPTH